MNIPQADKDQKGMQPEQREEKKELDSNNAHSGGGGGGRKPVFGDTPGQSDNHQPTPGKLTNNPDSML